MALREQSAHTATALYRLERPNGFQSKKVLFDPTASRKTRLFRIVFINNKDATKKSSFEQSISSIESLHQYFKLFYNSFIKTFNSFIITPQQNEFELQRHFEYNKCLKLPFQRSENVVFKPILLPDKNGKIFQILKTQQLTNLDFYVPTAITQSQNSINKAQMESINYPGTPDKIIMLWLHTPTNILAKG